MGSLIGLDTSVLIYYFEENFRHLLKAESILRAVVQGEVEAIFSSIGMIEILTGPKKQGRHDLAAQYKELLAHFPHLRIIGINEHIVDIASDLRASYGITTPDAIHIATAIDQGATSFITNDRKLTKVKELAVKLL